MAHRPLRLATWNIQWFNALFSDKGKPLEDDQPSARYHVSRAEQLGAIAIVMSAMDADGIVVIEAPNQGHKRSTVRALEHFAQKYQLRCRKALIGFPSDTEQEIAFLYDPDRISAHHDPKGAPSTSHGEVGGAPRFDTVMRMDLDGDGVAELVTFSKPPLEIAARVEGHRLRLIGVHAKSKGPHGIVSAAEFRRISIDNRRKQLAQCLWLRGRVEEHLAAGEPLVVLGDFNDGPGLDEYEKLFGHSGIEVVLGLEEPPERRMWDPNADMTLSQHIGLTPTTARFWNGPQKRYFEAMLDFIMVSPEIDRTAPKWRIWHPFDDPTLSEVPELREALLQASDHFPVSLDLDLARLAPREAGKKRGKASKSRKHG